MLYLPTFSQSSPSCPQCGQDTLQRLFSTFSVHKTDRDIYDDILSDSQLTKGMMSNDPKALVEWNKRMSRGEKAPTEYEEMITRMEKGEMPTKSTGGSTSSTTKESD